MDVVAIYDKYTFTDKFKLLFEEKGISQNKLSKETGINKASINSFLNARDNENPQNPTLEMIRTIAEYFDVSIDYLVTDTNVRTNDANIKSICEYTGLSEENVKYLNDILLRLGRERFEFKPTKQSNRSPLVINDGVHFSLYSKFIDDFITFFRKRIAQIHLSRERMTEFVDASNEYLHYFSNYSAEEVAEKMATDKGLYVISNLANSRSMLLGEIFEISNLFNEFLKEFTSYSKQERKLHDKFDNGELIILPSIEM